MTGTNNSERQTAAALLLNRTAVKSYAHNGPRRVIDRQCLFEQTLNAIRLTTSSSDLQTHLQEKCDKITIPERFVWLLGRGRHNYHTKARSHQE